MYTLGIDLGTTFTAAAVWRAGRAEMCALGTRTAVVPSVVVVRPDGSGLTGEAAARRALAEPSVVAREFKRRFGDATPVVLGGTPFSPEALSARLLSAVVAQVTAREGGAPARVCVSHPANWGPFKIDLLGQAVRLADLSMPVDFVTEPEAAAVCYARQARLAVGDTVAVYDLGGGTFDAAVLRRTVEGFRILGQPDGIERLGGVDIDAAVFHHVVAALGDAFTDLDEDDPAAVTAVSRLRQECVEAKEALSSDTDVVIPVILPDVSTEVRLTRAELETMVRPALYDSIESVRRALRSARVEAEDLRAVLLVGGSSRMPLVAQLVGAELGRPVAVDTHPKHAVALGAAWVAGETGPPHDGPSIQVPAPAPPASVTPAPVTPAPMTPAPVTPAPATPAPMTPAPETSAPMTPAPETSAPATPSPMTSAPVTPAPVTPPVGPAAPDTPATGLAPVPAVIPAKVAGPAPDAHASAASVRSAGRPTPPSPVAPAMASPEYPPGAPLRYATPARPTKPRSIRLGPAGASVGAVILIAVGTWALLLPGQPAPAPGKDRVLRAAAGADVSPTPSPAPTSTVRTAAGGASVARAGAPLQAAPPAGQGRLGGSQARAGVLQVNVRVGGGPGRVHSDDGRINCPGTCTATFGPGQVVTLRATGTGFLGWFGCLQPENLTCRLTGNASFEPVAAFRPTNLLTAPPALRVQPTVTPTTTPTTSTTSTHTSSDTTTSWSTETDTSTSTWTDTSTSTWTDTSTSTHTHSTHTHTSTDTNTGTGTGTNNDTGTDTATSPGTP